MFQKERTHYIKSTKSVVVYCTLWLLSSTIYKEYNVIYKEDIQTIICIVNSSNVLNLIDQSCIAYTGMVNSVSRLSCGLKNIEVFMLIRKIAMCEILADDMNHCSSTYY